MNGLAIRCAFGLDCPGRLLCGAISYHAWDAVQIFFGMGPTVAIQFLCASIQMLGATFEHAILLLHAYGANPYGKRSWPAAYYRYVLGCCLASFPTCSFMFVLACVLLRPLLARSIFSPGAVSANAWPSDVLG